MVLKNFDKWKLPLYKIYSDDEDVELVSKIIKRGSKWAIGPEIEELEHAIKEYVGTDYCLTFNSGTSALHAAFLANGIGRNDEIIVPSFSFISTANSVLFVNAQPVFTEIEELTYGINPELLSEKINNNTKAIVPMDYGGMSCKIAEIKEIAESNNTLLIEDAAEGLGSSINNKKVGSFSDSAIFSFCGNKVLTTGEGGAIVTNSKQVYDKAKLIRSHGRVDNKAYFDNEKSSNYLDIGYNWRMSSITAALGISQLRKLDKIIKMRQKNASYLIKGLEKNSEIILPRAFKNFEHIYQMFTIRLKNKRIRDELQNFLTEKKIFSKIYFEPIHLSTFYREKFGFKKGDLPITEKISEQVLTIPLYPNMNKEEMDYLINSILEFFETKE